MGSGDWGLAARRLGLFGVLIRVCVLGFRLIRFERNFHLSGRQAFEVSAANSKQGCAVTVTLGTHIYIYLSLSLSRSLSLSLYIYICVCKCLCFYVVIYLYIHICT